MNPARPLSPRHGLLPSAVVIASLAALAGCSSLGDVMQGDKVDYKSGAAKTVSLEVPPDLTQLSRDGRYMPASGIVSASTLKNPVAAKEPGGPAVAPNKAGDVVLERAGAQRWLSTPQTPEQLWPLLQAFWQERGFLLETEQKETGLMETNWVENRAKVPQDFIRSTIGKVFDGMYDSGERDRFRTRVERGANGRTEVYISHRGMVEVYNSERKDSTVWQVRPSDPDLEALMLSRLMMKLGVREELAKSAETASGLAAATPGAPRARMVAGAGLQVDDGFDRAWRRVGLALDRSGFTVEDRDRKAGQYFVRYVDTPPGGKAEPGFFAKLFGADDKDANAVARYRVALKSAGESTTVSVLNAQGAPENSPTAQRILDRLLVDLK